MAQHDQNIANDTGANVRADINNALAAIFTLSSGASAPGTTVADQIWVDTTNNLIRQRNAANSAWVTIGRRGDPYWGLVPHGQCVLEYVSASQIRLSRRNGRYLLINGVVEEVPSGGVTLSSSGLAANDTLYYIYAYMSSGTMTLEASTTAPGIDSTTGVRIKSGDATRTLVGAAAKTSGNFVDSDTGRYVRSWFHDSGIALYRSLGSDASVGWAPWAQLSSSFPVYFVHWADEAIELRMTGAVSDTSAGTLIYGGIGLNSTSGVVAQSFVNVPAASYIATVSTAYSARNSSAGLSYATILSGISGGSAPKYHAGGTNLAVTLGGSGA